MRIGMENARLIDKADVLIAVLDGPDVDSGVAAEVGFAYARGKRILGYRSDFRPSGDSRRLTVNLQVEAFIKMSGGKIYSDWGELIAGVRGR